ncbi:MAG: hypothetical protein E7240_06775 [Lachnospiraceae bacterium]|nr:hypothetical protein [Lachnospiraceae bacterium]
MSAVNSNEKPITLRTMGSFAFGGTVTQKEDGVTFHGEHGYTQYFVPQDATDYPVILWHGLGVCGTCFESAPDGREGFWQMFQRNDVPVYIIDQPRRGRASYTATEVDWTARIPVEDNEAVMWETYRYGTWRPPHGATYYPGSQGPRTGYAIDQMFRRQTPNHGKENTSQEIITLMTDSMGDLLEKAGPSILFSYSHSGKYGWYSAVRHPENVAGILSYEPGQCLFPDDLDLGPIESPNANIRVDMTQFYCPREQWMNLTKFPIRIFYGDYINKTPTESYGDEVWRISTVFAEKFAALINENGGDAKVIYLPEHGITGNGHTAFSEANNKEVFDLVLNTMKEAGMTTKNHPYTGPVFPTGGEISIPME